MKKLVTLVCATAFILGLTLSVTPVQAQYNPGPGMKVSWQLDPRDDADLFDHGPAFGARSVLVGMDFDGDGRREILFTTDETLAPNGPDPGFLDVFLYEATGNDSYEYVWHYTMPEGSNSLPALTYGDIDSDGKWEIYFGVPTLDNPAKTHIFEQGDDGLFPATPTLTYDHGRDPAVDFRPAGYVLADVDDDGKIELITQSRKSGFRELTVSELIGESLDEFAAFEIEFEAGEDLLGGGGTYDIDVADFDNDGFKEIWFNTWDNFSFTIFEATGEDTYELQVDLNGVKPVNDPGSFNSHELFFVDIDGDGLLEGWFPMTDGILYFLDDTDDVSTLTGDSFIAVGKFAANGRSRGAHYGDIDSDGRPDIVAGWGTGEKVSRIEYQEIGDPADSTSYTWSILLDSSGDPADRYYPPRVAPVDLDGDGLKEVVLTNLYASEDGQPIIIVLEYDPSSADVLAANWSNSANGAWSEDGAIALGARSTYGGMDMDQDGNKEVIVTNYGAGAVNVFEYNAGALELVWSSPEDSSTGNNRRLGSSPRTVGVGDLDGDGKSEIIFPLASEPSGWYVFEWDGVVGSDNYGTVYSSVIGTEIDTCCGADYTAFRADHERTTIADVDGDGQQEFISMIRRNASGGQRGTLVSHVEGDIVFEGGGNGFETWVVEFFVNNGEYGGGSPYHSQPADLDGDGSMELVNHTWNNFNFYNVDVTGTDTYAVADPASGTQFFKTTEGDHVSLFGGDAADVDGDGDDEVYFPNYYTGDLYVVNYSSGDDVLAIGADNVVKVASGVGVFHCSIFDVDKNGTPNIFTGSSYPKTIVNTEFIGTDVENPADYMTSVVYTGEADVMGNIVVTDSAGVMTTTFSNTGAFASKTQAHYMGEGLDFDGDGNFEVLSSYQSVVDSISTTNYTWNETTSMWDTVVTKVANPKPWTVSVFEFTGTPDAVKTDFDLITPDDYTLEQNYPNPFNPSTKIQYKLPLQKKVSLKIYNIRGQLIKTLVNGQVQDAGTHEVVWNGLNKNGVRVASGVYVYSLEFGNFKKTKRMTLLK
ncbi:MAG: T9SS C-terminal target domain-containing protein [Calditrichaeota bacterium]|nr:MAG: T9SS C-terminal target domain-containing protein [Calditrichota bacterium]